MVFAEERPTAWHALAFLGDADIVRDTVFLPIWEDPSEHMKRQDRDWKWGIIGQQ